MKIKLLAMLLALLACLLPLSACKGKGRGDETRETIELDTSDGYDYGSLDYKGEGFTFLQCDENRWGMKTALAPEAGETGDEVSDAVYSRNVKVETLYNVVIKCINRDIYETGEYVRTQCFGGDSTVDAAYVVGSSVATLIGEGLLNDFSEMNEVQIYEPWWGQKIREASQFGGSSTLYYAQSDISVTAFELTWCVAVNLDRISTLDMENPYELVRGKQWTMEKMFEMAEDGMQSNTDGSYTYSEDTDCILGFVTYNNYAAAGLNGAGCFLTQKDDIGNPTFTGEGQKFLDVVERYATAFHTPGKLVHAQEEGFHYEDIFAAKRSLFAGIEIKATSAFRAAGIHYGILPVPMYDDKQETYYSNVNYLAPLLVIPNTNKAGEATGRILDTMAYLSYKDLLPVYYDSSLSYKSLGTPDSVEMLNIIRDTRCFETGLLYGWTTDFYVDVRYIFVGLTPGTSASTAIGSYREPIIQELNDFITKLK